MNYESILFLLLHGRTVNDYFSDTKSDLARILAEGIDFSATAEPTFEVRRLSERGEDGGDEFGMALGATIVTRAGHSIPFVYELVEGMALSSLVQEVAVAAAMDISGVQRRHDAL